MKQFILGWYQLTKSFDYVNWDYPPQNNPAFMFMLFLCYTWVYFKESYLKKKDS